MVYGISACMTCLSTRLHQHTKALRHACPFIPTVGADTFVPSVLVVSSTDCEAVAKCRSGLDRYG